MYNTLISIYMCSVFITFLGVYLKLDSFSWLFNATFALRYILVFPFVLGSLRFLPFFISCCMTAYDVLQKIPVFLKLDVTNYYVFPEFLPNWKTFLVFNIICCCLSMEKWVWYYIYGIIKNSRTNNKSSKVHKKL